MNCKNCGNNIEYGLIICPTCGERIANIKENRDSTEDLLNKETIFLPIIFTGISITTFIIAALAKQNILIGLFLYPISAILSILGYKSAKKNNFKTLKIINLILVIITLFYFIIYLFNIIGYLIIRQKIIEMWGG